MTQALEGITVLDFTQGMAGSIATMALSDFGAEVIKIEPPEGDPYRATPQSHLWDRGKKSVVLDLNDPDAVKRVRQLAERADVVVETFKPGAADSLGVGYEALKAARPDLVYCSITGFGPKGPYSNYKDYDGLIEAKSGRLMTFAGIAGREGPSYAVVNAASHAAGMGTVRGVVSALMVRDQTGQGQKIETSLLQAITYYDLVQFVLWQMMIKYPETFDFDPTTVAMRASPIQYLPVRTKDGKWMQLANLIERLFRSEIHAIGLGHIYDDPRFVDAPNLVEEDDREELRRMILARMQEKTEDEWMDLFINEEGNVAAEPFMTATEALSHPQVIHDGYVQNVEDPTVGLMRQLGPAFHMDSVGGTPPRIRGTAPALGQHTEDVLKSLETPILPKNGNGSKSLPKHPLDGVTVLDLSTVIAGPLAGSLLTELGARVIRIETLAGDYMRGFSDGVASNRTMAGTEGLSLDLKTEECQEILRRLIPKMDVVMHNMRPGAPERVGIGLEQVRELNPDINYIYVAGYGSSGPYHHRPAMHPIGGAVAGGALTQAGRGALPPEDAEMTMEEIVEVSRVLGRSQDVNPDPNTSMVASTAVVMGLYARQRTGKPQYTEVSMIGANAYANADDFFDYDGKPPRLFPDSDGYGIHALDRIYEAQEGWVFLACPLQEDWLALCDAIERSDLRDDPRFSTPEKRLENDDALIAELVPLFKTRSPQDWETELSAKDVGCVRVEDSNMYGFFNDDEHVRENEFITEVEHKSFGRFWRYSPLLNFSKTPGKAGGGILRGQHTMPILKDLGYTEDEVHAFKAKGVLDWEEAAPLS
ncbi:MAG: CoA transferase [SAR202 cluster bacterium]|nr:CoA transferase [SAR202 cluster bacterium]